MVPWLILCLAGVHQLAGDATKMYVSWNDLMVVSIGIPPNHFSDYFSMVLINLFFWGVGYPGFSGTTHCFWAAPTTDFGHIGLRKKPSRARSVESSSSFPLKFTSHYLTILLWHFLREISSLFHLEGQSLFIPPTEREKTPRPSQPFVSQPFSDLGDRPFHKHLVPWYLGLHFFERTTERPHFEWSNTRVSCEIWVTFERQKKTFGSFEW